MTAPRKGLRVIGMLVGTLAVMVAVVLILPWSSHGHCQNPDGMDHTYYFWRWMPLDLVTGGRDAKAICLEKFGTKSVVISDHWH